MIDVQMCSKKMLVIAICLFWAKNGKQIWAWWTGEKCLLAFCGVY